MRFGVGLSGDLEARTAAAAAVRQALDHIGGVRPDLAMVFVSAHHADAADQVSAEIRAAANPHHLIGTTGESIVGGDREVEGEPAVAVWLARLPGVNVRSFALEFHRTPEGPAFLGLPDDLGAEPAPADASSVTQTLPAGGRAASAFVLLGDPFSFPMDALLDRLNDEFPRVPIIGGMASAVMKPGGNRMFLGDQALPAGAVGVHLSGDFRLRTVVSQGCRPIGRTLVITKARGNILEQLGGKPAFEQLKELLDALPPRDQALLRQPQALHVGRVINEYQEKFGRGDFLIRSFMGFDPDSGAIAVADEFRVGQTVQFHLRDAAAADEELRELLTPGSAKAAGALLFSCNGRGSRMFSVPNHDVGVLREQAGAIPVAGFFAAGELGPVGGRNFIHGFTASIALFEERGGTP